jgi:hypothetical protein
LNPHGIATTSPSNWRVCHSTTRALDERGAKVSAAEGQKRHRRSHSNHEKDLQSRKAFARYLCAAGGLPLAGKFAGAAGTTGAAGATGAALSGDDFDTGFDNGITLDGADENGRSKMLPVTRRADASARKIDVAKKIAASDQVALLSALPAPLAPNTV